MVTLTAENANQLHITLRDAVVKCSERCLYQSAKWAAELLSSLPHPAQLSPGLDRTDEDSQMFDGRPDEAVPIIVASNDDPEEATLEAREANKYLLAKSYFDCREYDRCAGVFLPTNLPLGPVSASTSPLSTKLLSPALSRAKGKAKRSQAYGRQQEQLPQISQRSLFLALYAKFMAGEKRKDEDSEMILGPADGGPTVNKELVRIAGILEEWLREDGTRGQPNLRSQGWLEYLYGIVLAKGKNDDDARKWLIRSVNIYPYNWGAWQELSGLLGSVEILDHVLPLLPSNLMTLFFAVYANQEFYQSTEAVHNHLSELQRIFPESQFLKTQRALLFYHSKDLEEAESIFAAIVRSDPHRIDSLDHYSNILYVMGTRPKLAFLAQLASSTDKFRPETCCVVGNYYSLKSEHEKAVVYFRRALTLDRSFTSAWTLMGHEYVEMKNTHAAIESYRRAVDVNRKDYRAWYGLGQTYEMLEMHYYALFYHQRAASLRPYDPKMWQAVGSCFSKMDRPIESIKAHKRALIAGSYYDQSSSFGSSTAPGAGAMDPDTLYQIALMYEKLQDYDEASAYMELVLDQEAGAGADDAESLGQGGGGSGGVGVTPTTSKARMWLAKYMFSRGGPEGLARAMKLANELCQDGVEVEEAKALVRDLRARMEGGDSPGA
ncbi:MAG: Anaphase-promoting complex subunit 23 [Thelocarpon impressellum]|nr:MAG: Anaphase-promoting complex subunit 23 [Thelocarpon impressellum]